MKHRAVAKVASIALVLALLLGCRGAGGDSLINATDKNILLQILGASGETKTLRLPPGRHFVHSRTEQGYFRYKRVEAFDETSRIVGTYDIARLPNSRGKFGKFVCLVIFDDGIYPLRNGAVAFDRLHNSRLPDGRYDWKRFKGDIVSAYQKELQREEWTKSFGPH